MLATSEPLPIKRISNFYHQTRLRCIRFASLRCKGTKKE